MGVPDIFSSITDTILNRIIMPRQESMTDKSRRDFAKPEEPEPSSTDSSEDEESRDVDDDESKKRSRRYVDRGVLDQGSVNEIAQQDGSIFLHYKNSNTPHTILCDSSQQHEIINVPEKFRGLKLDRVEVAHVSFVLYSRLDGQGESKPVDSISGPKDVSAEDVDLPSVKSIKIR